PPVQPLTDVANRRPDFVWLRVPCVAPPRSRAQNRAPDGSSPFGPYASHIILSVTRTRCRGGNARFRRGRESPAGSDRCSSVTDRRLVEIDSYFMSFLASLIVAAASSVLLFSASSSSGMCCNALIRT